MESRKPSVKLDQTLRWKTWQRLRGSANFLDFPFAHMPIAQVIPSDSWFPICLGEKDPVCSNKARSPAFHNSQERLHVFTRWQILDSDRANYQTLMTILLRIKIWRARRVDAIKVSISVQASWSLRWLLTASFTTMAMTSGETPTMCLCVST